MKEIREKVKTVMEELGYMEYTPNDDVAIAENVYRHHGPFATIDMIENEVEIFYNA